MLSVAIIGTGGIGLIRARSMDSSGHSRVSVVADADLSGGDVLQEQGIHMVDVIRVFLAEPSRVLAETRRCFWALPEVEGNCFSLFETPTEQLTQLHISWTQ